MKSLVIHTLANEREGMGHVVREITLARELERRGMVRCRFVTEFGTVGEKFIRDAGFPYRVLGERLFTDGEFAYYHDGVIVDVKNGPARDELVDLRQSFGKVICVGGVGFPMNHSDDIRELTDLQIYQGELFDYPTTDKSLNGPAYLIVDPDLAVCSPAFAGHIVIAMGGADQHRLTEIALDALTDYYERPIFPVVGAARIKPLPSRYSRFATAYGPPSLLPYLSGAALTITATGMTSYESMCAGVPCLLTNLTADHARTATKLENIGVACNLGLWRDFVAAGVRAAVDAALSDEKTWRLQSLCAKTIVDGRGVGRVADRVEYLLKG